MWPLDRLGRSLGHLIETVRDLHERGVHFRSLQERLHTATSGGKLVFDLFGALAEFERNLTRERTQAGPLLRLELGAEAVAGRGLCEEKVRQLPTLELCANHTTHRAAARWRSRQSRARRNRPGFTFAFVMLASMSESRCSHQGREHPAPKESPNV